MTTESGWWHGSKVLVTGASGFLGSHLCDRLAALGAEVHGTSRRAWGDAGSIAKCHVVDLTSDETVDLVDLVQPDVVFHLASMVTGTRDLGSTIPIMNANLATTVNLLAAVAREPRTKVVLAGSMEEPAPDSTSAIPASPYAAAKWAATGYARMFHALWHTQVSVLRIAMAYGPAQRDLEKLVPYVISTLLRGEEPTISGGTRLIDWVYVDDVVDAFLSAAEHEAAAGHTFDIGSGVPISIRETVDFLHAVVSPTVTPRYGARPDRLLEGARISDLKRTTEVLGWRPTVGFEDGMRRTVAWYVDHLQCDRAVPSADPRGLR